MPRINLSLQHRQTLEEAQGARETAVPKVHSEVGALLRQATRSADHRWVWLDEVGFWGERETDAQEHPRLCRDRPVGEAAR